MKHYLRMVPLLAWLLCSFTGLRAATPTLPSSAVTFNTIEGNHLGFYWTRGDGDKRIVIARAGQPVSARPENGKSYTASLTFGQGEAIKPGEFVVGYGNINQVTLSGLTSGVDYYIAIFEFNGDGTTTEYLTTGFLTGNKKTVQAPTTQVSGLQFSNITANKATINWTHGNGYGRMIVMREGGAVNAEPVEFVNYNANANFGFGTQIGTGNYVVYNWYINPPPTTVYQLKNGVTYHVAAYEFNGWSAPAFARPAATASFTTLAEPSKAPTSLYADSRDTKQFRILFPAGDGTKRILIGRKGSPVTTVPQDGVTYTPNMEFGKGSKLGTDEFVIYAGTDWMSYVTGLEPGATYHFRAFEYEDAGTTNYLTSSFAEGSSSTLIAPTTGITNFTATDLRAFQLTLNWTKGDGNNRILIGKANAPVDVTPEDFKTYTGSTQFGRGQEIGNGNFVILDGNYTSQTTITQLQPGITYHFAIFEANGTVNPIYLKPGQTVSAATQAHPTTHPKDLSIDLRALTTMRVYCNMGNGTKLLVIAKKGSPVTAVPVDKKVYRPSWKFADGEEIAPGEFVIHADTWNAPTVNTLDPNTTYHFRVINYNEINGEPFYYTAAPMTDGSGTTIDYARPQASNLTFPEITHTGIKLKFTAGGGNRRLITYKIGAPVDVHPTDGSSYGGGHGLGNGNFILGYTSTDEYTATGLTAGTNYHFAIYEITPNQYFYTPVPLTGQATTTGSTQTITFPDMPAQTYGNPDFDPQATASSGLPVTYEFSHTNYVEIVNGKIHILRSGTITVTAKQAGDATYAPAPPVSKTLTINRAPLIITAVNQTKPYGANIPTLSASYNGFVLGETASVLTNMPVLSTSATATSPPGDYTINISGASGTNYNITHRTGILTIQPPPRTPQTITFPTIAALRYGMAHVTPQATATSGLPVFFTSGNTNVAQIVNGQIQIKGAGTAKITANCPGDQTWEDAPGVEQTITINKADLTILAEDKIMTQGNAVPALTARYIGLVYNEQPTVLTTAAQLVTTATRASLPGTYPITVTGATSGNYNITMTAGSLLVQPRPKLQQTITFAAITDKTYGNAAFAAGATASSGLPVTYRTTTPTVVSIVGGQIRIIGTGTAVVFANQAGNNDYEAALETSRTFAVQRAPLEVRADNKTKVEGQNNPPLTVRYTGFVNGESAAVLTQQATPTTNVTNSTPAGQYDIFPGSAIAANYVMTYVNGVFTVTAKPKQPQTINFPTLTNVTYGDADFGITATATSNLPVSFTSLTPDVATITNGQIHILKAGTVTIRASQDGNTDYLAAAPIARSFMVNKVQLTVTAENKTKVQGTANPTLTVTYTGFVKNENFNVFTTQPVINTTATLQSPVGNYVIRASGAVAANYTFVYVNGTLTVTARPKQPQTINFPALANRQYGNAAFGLTATATSSLAVRYVNETPAIISINGTQVTILKAGRASIRAEQDGNNDWLAAAAATQAFDVEKAPLTVTADNKTKVEGTDNPALTVNYTGFLNGDDAGDIQTLPVVTTNATRTSAPGNYPINASAAVADNYRFTYVAGTLTVTPRAQAQTIQFAAPAPRTYGDADVNPAATATSGLAISYTSTAPAVATIVNGQIHITGAGTTTITAEQPGNNDWLAAAPVSRTFTVGKAQLTITAENKSKVTGTANPPLTASYQGFVLNENAGVLTTPVALHTLANENSPAGKYPIQITGGAAANYNIRLVQGILTVINKPKDDVKAWCSSRSTLQIRVYVNEAQGANVILYSTSGQRVSQLYKRLDAGSNTMQLDVSRIPTGMYVLHINGEKTSQTQNVAIN